MRQGSAITSLHYVYVLLGCSALLCYLSLASRLKWNQDRRERRRIKILVAKRYRHDLDRNLTDLRPRSLNVTTVTDSPDRRAERQQTTLTVSDNCGCSNVLLIILFNQPHYDNIPFLKQLYGSAFCNNMVFYGPAANSEYSVQKMEDPLHGLVQQQTIAQAYRDFPAFNGYLWSGDDVLFNPKLLLGVTPISLEKAWVVRDKHMSTDGVVINELPVTCMVSDCWAWQTVFRGPYSTSKLQQPLRVFVRNQIPDDVLDLAREKLNGKELLGASSDFGYIPGSMMPRFVEFVGTRNLKWMFFEIFIPTFLRLLTNSTSDYVEVAGVYLWSEQRQMWKQKFNCQHTPFLHPVKFSSQDARKYVLGLSGRQNCNWTWVPEPKRC